MSRIMVLGAGRGQVDLIKSIKRYGHEAIVVSIPGNYPGFNFADEIFYGDITNPLEVENIVKKTSIDGICTCCMDTGIESVGYICDKYGFTGVSYESAKASRDKFLMKEKFNKGNVNTPKYIKVTSVNELFSALDILNLPVIVKAVDQQGSLGINVVYSKDDLLQAYEDTMQHTKKGYCIIEEFIEGEKHGANGCIVNNQILFFSSSKDLTYSNFVLGHVFPLETNSKVIDEIYKESIKAASSLNLNNCIFNVDYIISKNKVYILEITGRLGANGIPELLSIYYNIDIYKILIDLALGINPTNYFNSNHKVETPCCSKMIISNKSGVLNKINNKNIENVVDITYFVSPGDRISKYKSAKDCLGQIITKGNTTEECIELAKIVESNIEFVLEEE